MLVMRSAQSIVCGRTGAEFPVKMKWLRKLFFTLAHPRERILCLCVWWSLLAFCAVCACTCLTENLGNHLAPCLHTAQVSKSPKACSFVSNESLPQTLSIAGAMVSAAVNQWSLMEAGGALPFYTSWKFVPCLCPVLSAEPWGCRQQRQEAAPHVMTACGAVAQCPQRAASLMQCGFIICPGKMRTRYCKTLSGCCHKLFYMSQSLQLSHEWRSQPSFLVVKKAVSDSLSLAPLHFTQQRRFPLLSICLVFQCHIWVPVRPRNFLWS